MSARTIRPTGNKILVKPLPVATHTEGGIELPVAYQQPSGQGIVLAVGPGKHDRKGNLIPTDVKTGDKVIYSWINGVELEGETGNLVLLDKNSILGIAQ